MRPEKKLDSFEPHNLQANGRLTESEEAPGYQEENKTLYGSSSYTSKLSKYQEEWDRRVEGRIGKRISSLHKSPSPLFYAQLVNSPVAYWAKRSCFL